MLKLGSKQVDAACEASTELKFRAAWQRRNLAMDLAGLATFEVAETWAQYLFTQLLKEQPRGFARVTLQQLIGCNKHLFAMASHMTMGKLASSPDEGKPLDVTIAKLKDNRSAAISDTVASPKVMKLLSRAHRGLSSRRSLRREARALEKVKEVAINQRPSFKSRRAA
jgi:sarcosine oxidase delta subunit